MIGNVTHIKMENIFNTSWLAANLTTLYVGLKEKFALIQVVICNHVGFLDEETLKYWALFLGTISTTVFIGYNLSKWYQQILETRRFKQENKRKNE